MYNKSVLCLNQSNTIIVEDEFHAFFICPKFIVQRENYLAPWYRQGDIRPEFIRLMQDTKPDTIKKLCLFIHEILKIKDTEYTGLGIILFMTQLSILIYVFTLYFGPVAYIYLINLCYVMLCYVMLCYVMLCYVMLCYVMLCYVTLRYATLRYVTLRYVTLRYVTLRYVMLCYVMLCYWCLVP